MLTGPSVPRDSDRRSKPVAKSDVHFQERIDTMTITKLTITAGLAAALACGSALAQTALVEVSDGTIVSPFDVAADVLDDFDVYTSAGNEIGDVEEIVGTDSGAATHVVVDFDDDFTDRDDVLVPIEALTIEANLLVVSLSADEVSALPAWDD